MDKLALNGLWEAVGGKKAAALLVVILGVKFHFLPIDWPLAVVLGCYFIGQGFADGLSKGSTSHGAGK